MEVRFYIQKLNDLSVKSLSLSNLQISLPLEYYSDPFCAIILLRFSIIVLNLCILFVVLSLEVLMVWLNLLILPAIE